MTYKRLTHVDKKAAKKDGRTKTETTTDPGAEGTPGKQQQKHEEANNTIICSFCDNGHLSDQKSKSYEQILPKSIENVAKKEMDWQDFDL